jgi:2-dehydro-3-deoxygluconokinase
VPRFQVVTLGEAMVRLSVRPGDRLEDAPAFDVHVAGSEANVAYALARMGVLAGWASALPGNPLGERVASTLRAGGVDLTPVVWAERGRVGTYFVQLGSPPRPTTVTYDRAGSTFALTGPSAFDWGLVTDTGHLHVSGITFAISDSAREVAHTAVREAGARGCAVSLDVNHRARMWTAEEAGRTLGALAGSLDLVICKGQDARDVFGCAGDSREVARRLQDRLQVPTVACTWGPEPATLLDGEDWLECASHSVEIVDRIGAGDAFAAGVLWGRLEGSLPLGLRRGVAMASLKMTVRGDLLTLDRAAVEALLGSPGSDVTR